MHLYFDDFFPFPLAYEVLSNEEKRQIYDQHGEEGLKEGHGGSPNDIFETFFNFGGQQRRDKRGHDITLKLAVSLEDLFMGNVFSVEIDKQILCPHCRGSGAKNPDDVHTCQECGGKGVKITRHQVAPGFFQQVQSTCPLCGGKGKVIRAKCPHCSGKKVKRGRNILDVSVEKGMQDGEKIVFNKQSDQSPDATPGDVIFVIETQPHSVFRRRGIHLYMTMTLTLIEALLGFEKKIVHLDQQMISVSRRAVTQPGFVLTIPDEGMPKHDFPSERGDLFIEFQVVLPANMNHIFESNDSENPPSSRKQSLVAMLYGDNLKKNPSLQSIIDETLRFSNSPPRSELEDHDEL
eukprot:Sdes_comp19509_c0_seq1m11058